MAKKIKKQNEQTDDLSKKMKDLFQAKMQLSTGRLKNTRSVFIIRKEISRIKTKIREEEIKKI